MKYYYLKHKISKWEYITKINENYFEDIYEQYIEENYQRGWERCNYKYKDQDFNYIKKHYIIIKEYNSFEELIEDIPELILV